MPYYLHCGQMGALFWDVAQRLMALSGSGSHVLSRVKLWVPFQTFNSLDRICKDKPQMQ